MDKQQGLTFSVFTPTYNRKNTLTRVFKSLMEQTYKNFEWIIVDDGSTDGTSKLIEDFKVSASFEIKNIKHANTYGKHIAYNNAIKIAEGDFFTVVDSDDEIDKDALEFIKFKWETIPVEIKPELSGIYASCRLFNGKTHSSLVQNNLVSDDIEIFYKLKLKGDRWWVRKTEVVRMYPFPSDFIGPYYTEGIIWKKIGKKYKILLVDKILYTIHYDGNNSLMRAKKPLQLSAKYVCLLAADHLNNYISYFKFYPSLFLTQGVYFSVYSFYTGQVLSNWKGLKLHSVLIILMLLPLSVLAHFLFLLKISKRFLLNR